MNKSFVILSLFLIGLTTLQAQQKEWFDVDVTVSNFKSNNGYAMIALYNKAELFLKTEFKGMKVKIEDNACSVTFKNLPKGVYAISLFHDENNNGKMDTNFFGIPKETYGCSNNARGSFCPPKWEDSKFEVTNKTVIQHIKL